MEERVIKDKDIREPLFDYLEQIFGKIRIIEEKTIGRSRADIVMVQEDGLCGIEIKSDADSYARLKKQTADYDRYFDRNIVAVGSTHGLHITEHVPEHWGIITIEPVENKLDFYMLRAPGVKKLQQRSVRKRLERKLLMLWRPELLNIQKKHGIAKYAGKSKLFVVSKILEKVPDKLSVSELDAEISGELFERDYTKFKIKA